MSFDMDSCLEEFTSPGKEKTGTQFSQSRMGVTVIPKHDSSTEVSDGCQSLLLIDNLY